MRTETIIPATATMTRPLLFSMLIIVTSFVPLAFSKTFAMAFSTLLTLFLLPAIVVWVFKRHIAPAESPTESRFASAYRPALVGTIRYRYAVVGLSAALLVAAGVVMAGFQKDYMREMEEGSILYMPTTLPGLPSKEAGWILQQMDRKLKAFPEVARVFGKLGRADTATDPAPVEMIETTVTLKPRSEWREGMTKDRLVAEMNQAMQVVGYFNSWTQPINTRVMMQDTGIQTPVGISQGRRPGGRRAGGQRSRGIAQGRPRHAGGHRRTHLTGLLRGRPARPVAHGCVRRDRRRSDADCAVRDAGDAVNEHARDAHQRDAGGGERGPRSRDRPAVDGRHLERDGDGVSRRRGVGHEASEHGRQVARLCSMARRRAPRYSALKALITSTRDALAAGTSDARMAAATSTAAAPRIGTGPGMVTSVT